MKSAAKKLGKDEIVIQVRRVSLQMLRRPIAPGLLKFV